MKERSLALDALRGFAILTMVLSGAIVFGVLPGWMYHAQVPPPNHVFDPSLPGITWVDLVFPFFLFAMGAAFPFSIGKQLDVGVNKWILVSKSLFRGLQLAFFAIFIQHFYPYVISSPQDYRAWLLAIVSFVLLFLMYTRFPYNFSSLLKIALKIMGYAGAVVLLLTTQYANGETFSLHRSNIIILVLANMAFFGSAIYVFTYRKNNVLFAILFLLMGLILSSKVENSWTARLAGYSPFPWLYQFNFLKYLLVVLPGAMVGGIIRTKSKQTVAIYGMKNTAGMLIFALILIAFIVINLVCLYNRYLVLNLGLNAVLITVGFIFLNKWKAFPGFWKDLFKIGTFLLLAGLFYEAFENGIKKDPATFSYYWLTSGLAVFTLLFFIITIDSLKWRKPFQFLVLSGQNPMIAYVSSSLFILPVMNIVHVADPFFELFKGNPFLGFLQGVVITGLVILVTAFFTKIKWFWRT